MKKLLLCFILFFTTFHTNAQWIPGLNNINFDPADTMWHHAIYIDTVNYHHNIWQVGKPNKVVFNSAFSAPNAIVTDTLYPYPPNDTSVFILTFPGHVYRNWIADLSFNYQLNIDTTSFAKIEYSPDSGKTWINLKDSTPSGFNEIPSLPTTTHWSPWGILFAMGPDGPYYHNDSIQFKFTFIGGSDTSGKDGWIIDNFSILYEMEGVPTIQNNDDISIYPNPATAALIITSADKINHVTITNLIGQILYIHDYNAEKAQVDVTNFPSGIYFIKINGTEVRKFVKQ